MLLAQLNIARMRYPLEHRQMSVFVNNLEQINALAERSPGFVWRLKDEDEQNATSIRSFGEDILVNLSVWESQEALHQFVYHSAHVQFIRRRTEWFERLEPPTMVLWWIDEEHRPDIIEAKGKLIYLQVHGPSSEAFSFRESFPAPDADQEQENLPPDSVDT